MPRGIMKQAFRDVTRTRYPTSLMHRPFVIGIDRWVGFSHDGSPCDCVMTKPSQHNTSTLHSALSRPYSIATCTPRPLPLSASSSNMFRVAFSRTSSFPLRSHVVSRHSFLAKAFFADGGQDSAHKKLRAIMEEYRQQK